MTVTSDRPTSTPAAAELAGLIQTLVEAASRAAAANVRTKVTQIAAFDAAPGSRQRARLMHVWKAEAEKAKAAELTKADAQLAIDEALA